MDSLGVQYMLEVFEGQLLIAQEECNDGAITAIKVLEDEFRKTFCYLE